MDYHSCPYCGHHHCDPRGVPPPPIATGACLSCGSTFSYTPALATPGGFWMCHCGYKTPISPPIGDKTALRSANAEIARLRSEIREMQEYREEMRAYNRAQARVDAIRGEPQGAPPKMVPAEQLAQFAGVGRVAAIDRRVSKIEQVLRVRGYKL